jgi:hypothetical protein
MRYVQLFLDFLAAHRRSIDEEEAEDILFLCASLLSIVDSYIHAPLGFCDLW